MLDSILISSTLFADDNSLMEPPDTFPNSEVKRQYANDSVASDHAKVGHRQHSFKLKKLLKYKELFLFFLYMVIGWNIPTILP